MNTKTLLGASILALSIAMIAPVLASSHLNLISGEVNNEKGNFEATLSADFEDCPTETVCGVGAFAADAGDHAARMLAITAHDFFEDHPDQSDDIAIPHTHTLVFDIDADCDAGVALNADASGIIDGAKHEVKGPHVEVSQLNEVLDTTVHSFTVDFGPNGEICPVIVDSAIDE